MKLITSWDDGKKMDLRLADMLKGFNLPGIFYIPTMSELSGKDIMDLHDAGFEIGGHTRTHPQDMKYLDRKEISYEIASNKNFLESIIGESIKTFAYPRGRYDERVIDTLKYLNFEWARTVEILKLDQGDDPFRTPTTIHVGMQRAEYQGRDWLEVAKQYFDLMAEKNLFIVFHIWGHSWEIDRLRQWEKLNNFLQYLADRRNLWQ